jgi:toxin-antitoxin system PIN domain toxin
VHEIHPHHGVARAWSGSIDRDDVCYFCRFTQLGLLRFLTNESAMGHEVLSQSEAWASYDALLAFPGNRMMDEPSGIEAHFRQFTSSRLAANKQWADGYLAAFAKAAGLTLVTFDRALAGKVEGAVLLG